MSTVLLLILGSALLVGVLFYSLRDKDEEVNEPEATTPEEVSNHATPVIEEEPIIVVKEVVVEPTVEEKPKRAPKPRTKKPTTTKKTTTTKPAAKKSAAK